MSAAPIQPAAAVTYSSNVPSGTGYGGDNGKGFHSAQPVSLERNDDTEKVQNRTNLQEGGDLQADAIAVYPKYFESPFTRYVSRPLSNGLLSESVTNFKPEDRSKMGKPLNPFWIRNDLWSIANEADIFLDATPNWIAPRINVNGTQDKQTSRPVYLDNEQQPQRSNTAANMEVEMLIAPTATAAGTVTGSEAAASEGTLDMENANPAKVNMESDGKEAGDVDIDAKKNKGGANDGGGDDGTDVSNAATEDDTPPPPRPAKKARKGGSKKVSK